MPRPERSSWGKTELTWQSAILAIGVLAILLSTFVAPSVGAPIDVVVNQSSVTLNLHLSLQENLTVLPQLNLYLGASNSTPVLQALVAAIQKLVPNVHVDRLDIWVRTTNSSRTWTMEEDYALTVSGSNANAGSSIRANLSFLDMSITNSIKVAGVELNALGSEYLLTPFDQLLTPQTDYYIDGSKTLNAVIPAQTTRMFYLLDLSWVPSISIWNRNDDLLNQATTWTFDPGTPRYNLTFGPRSPEGTLLRIYQASYYPSLNLKVAANSWTNDSTLSFDLPTATDTLMPTILGASLITLIASVVVDRKLTRPIRSKKKR